MRNESKGTESKKRKLIMIDARVYSASVSIHYTDGKTKV